MVRQKVKTNTIVIGGSAAGLAAAACLKRKSIPFLILEKEKNVGYAWRNHYDRLHLHTNKGASSLPFFKYPSDFPKYPAKDDVVNYLENYRDHFQLKPQYNEEVLSVFNTDGTWSVTSSSGLYEAENVIVCTGYTRVPNMPSWPGQEYFKGDMLHSAAYKNGSKFRGKRVLVVGFGNSACEIALCLHEHGAYPSMSVRSPVNILPKEILGIPVLGIGIALSIFPTKIADLIGRPAVKWTVGDPEKYGLKKSPYGPIEQIVRKKRIPLLDIGTLKLIRQGAISIFDDIESFEDDRVNFKDGRSGEFDAIILGTGYRAKVNDFIASRDDLFNAAGTPRVSGGVSAAPGLYFCGFYVSPTGMLREINIESKKIAAQIAKS